jgi:hypothetical protein
MPHKKIILLVILSLAAAASLSYGLLTVTKRSRKYSQRTEVTSGRQLTPAQSAAKRKSSFEKWGRNPFSLQKSAERDFVLSGIFQSQDGLAAIINEKIVSVGNEIEGCLVVSITEKTVVLNDGRADFELSLGAE